MKEIEPKRSAASWLVELAKGRYGEYALSVLTALLGVACSLVPYFYHHSDHLPRWSAARRSCRNA